MTRSDIVSVNRLVDLDDPSTRIAAANKLLDFAGSPERITEMEVATAALTAFLQQLLDNFQYIEAALLLWGTELFDPRPRSVKRVWNAQMTYDKNLYIGASAQGKSYTLIAWQLLRYVHDHLFTNIKNVSTTKGHALSNTWSTLTTFHKSSIVPLPGIVSSNFIGVDPINKQAGISVVAVPQGDEGKGRLQGFHPTPRGKHHPIFGPLSSVILYIDEGEDAPTGLWEGVDNMLANEDETGSVKIASSTNPKKRESMFGRKVEPKDGWGSVDIDIDEEWESAEGWHVTRLDAAKSENVQQKKLIFPGLQTYQGYMNLVRRGTSDPNFFSFARGWYPEQSAEFYVMPSYILNDARGTYIFARTPTPCASFDPAFSEGGDNPILTTGRFGFASAFDPFSGERVVFKRNKWVLQIEQQFPIQKDNTLVMAKSVKDLCVQLGVKPEFFVCDRTGNAQGLYDALLIDFGAILGVQWGEGATDKKILEEDSEIASELYSGVITEMWFAAAQWIEFGYMKFSPMMQTQKLFGQFTGRKYNFLAKTLRRVESKIAYKLRTGSDSPDEADSTIQLPHLIRMRQATSAAMMPDRPSPRGADGQLQWGEKMKSVVDDFTWVDVD